MVVANVMKIMGLVVVDCVVKMTVLIGCGKCVENDGFSFCGQ